MLTDIAQLGTILGIWAHPDDETFLTGGVMAAARQNGQTVACITATRGEAGNTQDPVRWPPDSLGAVRAAELVDALRILGIVQHHWLGYLDGRCQAIPDQQAIDQLLTLLKLYQPDTILTFAPDGLTGHQDHKMVSHWVRQVVDRYKLPVQVLQVVHTREAYHQYYKKIDAKINIYFNLPQPHLYAEADCNLVFHLPKDVLTKKCQALAAMPSQYAGMLADFPMDFLAKAFATESFIEATPTAKR